ncbi:MAG: hypothetical protein WCT27_01455 [Patescibacteria group bacterium]|jgi:hypothetical protein
MAKRHNIILLSFDVFTLIIWAWLFVDFFSRGQYKVPLAASSIYVMLLAFYVGDKEIRKLRQKYFPRFRHGEYFAYLWGITLLFMLGFYVWGGKDHGFHLPQELPTIAGSVLLLYFLTEYLKEGLGKKK